jgi:hypothetical protein
MKVALNNSSKALRQQQFLSRDLKIWKAYSTYFPEGHMPEYRKRILHIQDLANNFKDDLIIKEVEYTETENKIWK